MNTCHPLAFSDIIYDARSRGLHGSVPHLRQDEVDACPSFVTDRNRFPTASGAGMGGGGSRVP